MISGTGGGRDRIQPINIVEFKLKGKGGRATGNRK